MHNRERTLSQWLFYVLAALVLAACGGGSGDDVLPVQGVSSAKIELSLSNSAISPTGEVTATATLRNPDDSPIANQRIDFSLTGPATLLSISATTNAEGRALVQVSGNNATGGEGILKATYTDSERSTATSAASYSIKTSETLLLSLSKSTIKSGSDDSIVITAFLTDASGKAIKDRQIEFSAGGVEFGELTEAALTSTNGRTQASFSPSQADRLNKNVTITATTTATDGGIVSSTASIAVVGTILKLTADKSSTSLDETVKIFATLTDGAGKGIGGKSVVLSSRNPQSAGQACASASAPYNWTLNTDEFGKTGEISLISKCQEPSGNTLFYARVDGALCDINSVGSACATSLGLKISTVKLDVLSPLPNVDTDGVNGNDAIRMGIGDTVEIKAKLTENGLPINDQPIRVTSNTGELALTADGASTVSTQIVNTINGEITVYLKGVASAGEALIQFSSTYNGQELTASRSVIFSGTYPTKIAIQAEQTVLNPGAQTPITVTVRDSNDNPVALSKVQVKREIDSSGGSLSSTLIQTDKAGRAQVTFTAGPNSTSDGGVLIKATVLEGTQPSGSVNLTVGGEALFINISAGRTIQTLNNTFYGWPLGVIVTDASGAPQPNRTVTLKVATEAFAPGYYSTSLSGTDWVAVPTSTPAWCQNEDLNSNGLIDIGEDTNNNGRLDPGKPVTLSTSTVTTNASGYAEFMLIYGKNFANWVRVVTTASTSVVGTESKTTRTEVLLAVLEDMKTALGAPPGGMISPFGDGASCTDPF